jgi:hypothetical protein
MGLDIGGFEQRSDWPKMGPSLLIGTCLILAIRTAKWPATFNERCSEMDLDREIACGSARRPSPGGSGRPSREHLSKSNGARVQSDG